MKHLHWILDAIMICTCLAFLPGLQCTQPAPVNPVPVVVGGSPSTGGASATGGVSTGGQSATGGTTTSIRWLACNAAAKSLPRASTPLTGWHRTPAKVRALRHRIKASYSMAAPSVFNQPNLRVPLTQRVGSCTANGVAHTLSTWPFDGQLTEDDAERIYSLATTLDPFPGQWPPTDTGSNGASAALAAKKLGYTKLDFGAVDTIEGLQVALQRSSCVVGVDWYTGFFNPTSCGEMQMTGAIEGGHAPQAIAWDAERKRVIIRNSWGPEWGNCREGDPGECGYAYWSAGTFIKLLEAGGEIDCPIL